MLARDVTKAVVALFVAATAASALAQAPPSRTAPAPADARPVKIGVVDTEKILLSSEAGKRAVADLKAQQNQVEDELRRKKAAGASAETLRQSQEQATRDVNAKRDQMLAQIDQKVMPVINQIGKELGYTLIFRKFESGLIFADDAVDITAIVLRRVDAGRRP